MQLIDKTAAYNALKHKAEQYELSFIVEAFEKAARIIDQMPTIEAEPVRHGRWIPHRITSSSMCSECKKYATHETPRCPYCGAYLRGGVENG